MFLLQIIVLLYSFKLSNVQKPNYNPKLNIKLTRIFHRIVFKEGKVFSQFR